MGRAEHFIGFNGSRLYYNKSGVGPTPMILFHGFGQDNSAFEPWEADLSSQYTFFAFDLYFHGKSTWPERQALEKSFWLETMTRFLEKEGITNFEVAGFSLGGKFALAMIEGFPERISHVRLVAPDGVRTNFWYSLATYPTVMRHLFKSMVLKPGRFYTLARIFRSFGLVNKGILRFAESQMNTEEKRRRVYCSWVYFRHLRFDQSRIAALINSHHFPVEVIAGHYDKVIPPKNLAPFAGLLRKGRFLVLETGHNDLISKSLSIFNAAR